MLAHYPHYQQQGPPQAHTGASSSSYHAGQASPALNAAAKALLGARIQQIEGLGSADRAKLLHVIHNLETLDSSSDLAAAVPATLDGRTCPGQRDLAMQLADVSVCRTHTSNATQGWLLPPTGAAAAGHFQHFVNAAANTGVSSYPYVQSGTATNAAVTVTMHSSELAEATAAAGGGAMTSMQGNVQKQAELHRSMSCQETRAGLSSLDFEELDLPKSLSAELPSLSVPPQQQQQQRRQFDFGPVFRDTPSPDLIQLPQIQSGSNTAVTPADASTVISLPNFIADVVPPASAAAAAVTAANADTMQPYGLPPRPTGPNASFKPSRLQLPRLLPPSVAFAAPIDQQQQRVAAAVPSTTCLFDGAVTSRSDATAFECDLRGNSVITDIQTTGMPEVQHLELTDDIFMELAQELLDEADEQQQTAYQANSVHCAVDLPAMHALPFEVANAATDDSRIDGNARGNALHGLSTANAPQPAAAAAVDLDAQDGLLMWQQLRREYASSVATAGVGVESQRQQQPALNVTAAAAAAAARLVSSSAMDVNPLKFADIRSPPAAAAVAAAASVGCGSGSNAEPEVVRYARVITCKTYLKRLNITQAMADDLLPRYNTHAPPESTHLQSPMTTAAAAAAAAAATTAAATAAGGCGAEVPSAPATKASNSIKYDMLCREVITLVDKSGLKFKVQYEGVMCNNQKHLRFTSGWRDYVRRTGLQVGDTIVLECRNNDRHTLYVRVVKAGSSLPGSKASQQQQQQQQILQAEQELPNKKQKLTRKQAVQRLA